jgi:D-alanine transaminase
LVLKMDIVYLNGAFVPQDQAVVSVMDRGFLFGDGVYEVIPCYWGQPLRPMQHLQRLNQSLQGIQLANPLSVDAWLAIFNRLLTDKKENNQAIYLQITRGATSQREHRFPTMVSPTVLVMTKAIKPRDPRLEHQGVKAILRDDIRWQRCDIKGISLLASVLLHQQSVICDAEETLLMRDGYVTEGSTSNLFLVHHGQILTPPVSSALLTGITRDLVIELAVNEGLPIREQVITVADCYHADELWITSSTREVLPVTLLETTPIGAGVPGPVWRQINTAYQAYKQKLCCEQAISL